MSEQLVFVDDVERAGWFAVYVAERVILSNSSAAARADHAVCLARERCGRDLQAENAALRRDLADARDEVVRLANALTLLQESEP